MTTRLTAHEREAVGRVSGLVLSNAMVFQEVLAAHEARVRPLHALLDTDNPIAALAEHWKFIIEEINYYPIFHVARQVLGCLTADADVAWALNHLAGNAQKIVALRAALRHDLMGRVYHRLLADAKYLGTYYTSIPAAILLLELALQEQDYQIDWGNLDDLRQFRVADLACGTGTLLMAAADAVMTNYISASVRRGERVKPSSLQSVHQILAEDVLHGYDVLPSALHLTASTLALRAPEVLMRRMRLFTLPLGGKEKRLGSLEFLGSDSILTAVNLFGEGPEIEQLSGSGSIAAGKAELPELNLCVMNPPFTRSVGGNLLFGSMPDKERSEMQKRLKEMVGKPGVHANVTAGLGSVFVAAADRHMKDGARLALVLPKALLSGIAWNETRELFRGAYEVEYIVASHDPERWNFSQSTDLSEVLLVARKKRNNGLGETPARVVAVNLWRNPRTAFEALSIARDILREEPPDLAQGQGALHVGLGEDKMGEAVSMPWQDLRESYSWLLPCAFAQSDLSRTALELLNGNLRLPGRKGATALSLCELKEIASLGPDRRDIHDGFKPSRSATPYPALWGHDSRALHTIRQTPNCHLSPLHKAKKGRGLRKVTDLWPLAGRVLLGERLWLKTQRLVAVYVDRPVLSNVWWPMSFHDGAWGEPEAKALTLWLNSTLGLLILLTHRQETRGAWVDFKKPLLGQMPVLDVRRLSDEQKHRFAEAYGRVCAEPLLPLQEMATDPVRAAIDASVSEILGLPDYSVLREMLAREPIVCLRRL